jgi:TRAP-type uncharacterized transport system fused permease subunit
VSNFLYKLPFAVLFKRTNLLINISITILTIFVSSIVGCIILLTSLNQFLETIFELSAEVFLILFFVACSFDQIFNKLKYLKSMLVFTVKNQFQIAIICR